MLFPLPLTPGQSPKQDGRAGGGGKWERELRWHLNEGDDATLPSP